jgi:hypothetical protein
MTVVIVDAGLRQKLPDLSQPLELRDEAGRLLGRYTPVGGLEPSKREPQISEEEIQRRERREGGRPLGAILADLERRS